MKKNIFFVILICLSGCRHSTTSPEETIFKVSDLGKLDLTNFESLWQGDSVIQAIPYSFNNYEGYLDGIELRSSEKSLSVYVFDSKETAITSTEAFLQTIAMYTIEADNHDIIKEKWWSSPNSFNTIFVNKYNLIITVHSYLETDGTYTQNIAVEVMNRIEQNC